MWFALLLLSWFVELVVGVWFCYHFWMFTQVQYAGGAVLYGPGYAIVQGYNTFISTWDQLYHPHRRPFVLTQEHIALFFVAIYLALHLLALVRGLVAPARERRKLGVRRQPSGREIGRFEQGYASLLRAQAATADAPAVKRPRMWRVRDEDQGMQMRWIGRVLVIDRGLLYSRHFPALLAHELAHSNRFDLFTRGMYAIFPPFRWSVLTLIGLPCTCGSILFHQGWTKYWRGRVFAADEYAALIGQRYALKRALDELRWTLDGGRATRGGRWLRETPYIEERIDRLDRYQPVSLGTSSGVGM
jgi:Zn-dependent protease with chaperone function